MVSNSIEIQSSLDPYPLYAEMRKSRPINLNEMVHMWEVFRYNDVQRVLMEVPLQRTDSFFLYGVKHVPITFEGIQ